MPLKQGLDENHQRWPDFNQQDLAERKEAFLVMLVNRADEHPCEFAHVDTYRDNKFIAANEGLLDMAKSYISEPELVVVRMTSVEGEGDDYGTRYFAPDEEEAEVLENTLGTGMWFEVPAVQAMVIQRRIYQFLQLVVLRIMTDQSYAVANENNEKNWRPNEPDPNNVQSPQFNTDLSVYVDYLRNTMHYVAMNNTMELLTYGICYRQWTHYADQLKGLKSSPRLFYNYISDIREHSHHEVLHSINGRDERHRWVSHVNLLCNAKAEPLGADPR